MTYAQGRTYYDADSHIMELPDWLGGYVAEEMKDRIGPLQLGGAGRMAEAAVRQAELDLEFTELRAPVSGRIGDRRVSPGNLVSGGAAVGNTTLLATIVSLDPIRFEFTFDEASFLRYQRLNKSGEDPQRASVDVTLKLIDEDRFNHKGRLDFIDNAIDRSTGTMPYCHAQWKNSLAAGNML